MTRIEELAKGLEILVSHGAEDYDFQHDIGYFGHVPQDIPESAQLRELGFHWDTETNCWAMFS
jgi:hypothetical protein